MKDEEKDDLTKEMDDLGEKNCPLSITDWIMFLSGEIHNEEMKYFMFESITIVAVSIAIGMIAVALNLKSIYLSIFACCFLAIFLVLLIRFHGIPIRRVRSAIDDLKDLREKIITGKSGDSDKICERWMILYPK
jgi:hypothetical protein